MHMYRYLALTAFLIFAIGLSVSAQKVGSTVKIDGQKVTFSNDSTNADLYTYKAPPPVIKPARDFLMIALTYNNWISKPDTVKTRGFNYGFNGHLCYDFPIKKSKLSFATGLGVNVSVIYLNQQKINLKDTVTGSTAKFVADTTHYTRYKFVTTYLSAPFELRYFSNIQNRNKGFKAAIGLQIGTLLGADTKGVTNASSTLVKEKVNTKRFVSPWDFAATMRVGFGNFSLFASYNLTTVFKENEGPAITPASIGICLTGL